MVQILKIFSLSLNLVPPRLFQICKIRWGYSLFLFLTFLFQVLVKKFIWHFDVYLIHLPAVYSHRLKVTSFSCFSYNKAIQSAINHSEIIALTCLMHWRLGRLSIEGKVTGFRTSAISRIFFLALLVPMENTVAKEL